MTQGSDPTSRENVDVQSDFTATSYQWYCPICGQRGAHVGSVNEGTAQAIAQLKTHIRTTEGKDHGKKDTLPDDLDFDALDNYVIPLRENE